MDLDDPDGNVPDDPLVGREIVKPRNRTIQPDTDAFLACVNLLRYTAHCFYDPIHVIIMNALCNVGEGRGFTEAMLADHLRLDYKTIRKAIGVLKADGLVKQIGLESKVKENRRRRKILVYYFLDLEWFLLCMRYRMYKVVENLKKKSAEQKEDGDTFLCANELCKLCKNQHTFHMLDLILESKVRPDLRNKDSTFNCEECGEVLEAKKIGENRMNSLKQQFNYQTEDYLALLMNCIQKVFEEQRRAVIEEERRAKFGTSDSPVKIQQYKAKAITHMNNNAASSDGKALLPHLARFGKSAAAEDGTRVNLPLIDEGVKRQKIVVREIDPVAIELELEIQRKVEQDFLKDKKKQESAVELEAGKMCVMVQGKQKRVDELSDEDFERMTEIEYEAYNQITDLYSAEFG